MTDEVKEVKKELTPVQKLMAEVSDNPALVTWPRDRWGFTADLKKAILLSAGAVRGNADKHDLLLNTLAVAIAHVQKRRAKDVRAYENSKKFLKKDADGRMMRQRVSAAVPTIKED